MLPTKDITRLSVLLFALVVLFSFIDIKPNNLVFHLWIVVVAIVCPLMSHFIPGLFFYRVSIMKEKDD